MFAILTAVILAGPRLFELERPACDVSQQLAGRAQRVDGPGYAADGNRKLLRQLSMGRQLLARAKPAGGDSILYRPCQPLVQGLPAIRQVNCICICIIH